MKWILYNALFAVGYALMLPKFYRRMKKRGGYRANFAERFGDFAPETAARLREKPRVWVHAVSVGEANLAGNFIDEMRRRAPDESFIISTTSSTGRAVCEKLARPGDVVIYLPIDFPRCVRKALAAINAKALVLAESEFWPNLIRALKKRGVPVFLVNGRVSDRAAPQYRRIRWFFKDVFDCFSLMLAQSELDKQRLVAAGADAAKIEVMGSVKFDIPPLKTERLASARATLAAAGIDADNDFILLGGSTWPGEETALVRAWLALKEERPRAKLVIVPRHAERGDEIESELAATGVKILRRSKMKTPAPAPDSGLPLLVDATGELSALYPFASLVFIGKSLPPNSGAQNMIEPAAHGKPVLIGPNSENFAAVMALFRAASAIIEVTDPAALAAEIRRLAAAPGARAELGEKAKAVVDSQRGALARSAEKIAGQISPSNP